MGKRPKKKSGSRPSASPASGGGAADLLDLESSIYHLRGRRSVVLARQIRQDERIAADRRGKLVAAAHETYVREMLEGGHTGAAQDHARSVIGKEPEMGKHWALSLHVRLGLVDDLEAVSQDAAWRDRLRLELVDPADLLGCPVADIATDAQAVCEAWKTADSGPLPTAKTLIASIGRRSLLVDWRLFLQASIAAREGNAQEMDAALARIMPGTPAAGLGRLLNACLRQDRAALTETELAQALAVPASDLATQASVLSAAMKQERVRTSDLAKNMKLLLKPLLAERRPSAANLVVTSVCNKRLEPVLLDEICGAGVPGHYVYLCGGLANFPRDEWGDELDKLLRHGGWSPQERAVLLLEQAQGMRQNLESDVCFDDDDSDEEDGEDDLRTIQASCRQATGLWPGLRDIYATWCWAERYDKTHHAESAEVHAFPSDPNAWSRLVCRLAVLGKFKECAPALASLADLPGTQELCSRVTSYITFQKVRDACRREQSYDTVKSLAEAYKGDNPFEQVEIAVRQLMRASGKNQKRESGEALAALGHPWLAAVWRYDLAEEKITASILPAPLKTSLQANPSLVVADFLLLTQHPERSRIHWEDHSLFKALLTALENPVIPLTQVQDCLHALLLQSWHDVFIDLTCDFMPSLLTITARLLHSGDQPSPAAVAGLAFRVLLYEDAEIDEEIEQKGISGILLKTIRQLATNPQNKGIVRDVEDKVGFPTREGAETAGEIDALAIWRQQCTILTPDAFFKHVSSVKRARRGRRKTKGSVPPVDPVAELARIMGFPGGMDDDDGEGFGAGEVPFDEPLEKPAAKRKTPGKKAVPRVRAPVPQFDLNKCYPNSEIEFEALIEKMAADGNADDKLLLLRKIDTSTLSDAAKGRLRNRLAKRIEEKDKVPF